MPDSCPPDPRPRVNLVVHAVSGPHELEVSAVVAPEKGGPLAPLVIRKPGGTLLQMTLDEAEEFSVAIKSVIDKVHAERHQQAQSKAQPSNWPTGFTGQ